MGLDVAVAGRGTEEHTPLKEKECANEFILDYSPVPVSSRSTADRCPSSSLRCYDSRYEGILYGNK